jgi:chitinase
MAAAREREARVRVSRGIALFAVALLGFAPAACTDDKPPGHASPAAPAAPGARPAGPRVVGYFTDWGIYGRNYQVKDVETSGAAARLTHLMYAFGDVTDGRCGTSDPWADYQKPIAAAQSVDGQADPTSGTPLRGTIGQLRKLKAKHPQLKVLWSFGGWTGSAGFTEAAKDPAAFAESCRKLLTDKRWAGVFDGIDIDWEYPNSCGETCDRSGPDALAGVVGALRSALGPKALVTAAVAADAGKLKRGGYAAAAPSVDWMSAMTYDYFGTSAGDDGSADLGPTEPHSPLRAYPGIPRAKSTADATITTLLGMGIPANKILLGVGFYGRGWRGVTDLDPGGKATGPADGKYEKRLEDYEILAVRCPPTGVVGGTAYAHCGDEWWSYDTPGTIKTKMAYAKSKSLGGAFAWELSGDTAGADLLKAMSTGLD